jgi:hypothetical protein
MPVNKLVSTCVCLGFSNLSAVATHLHFGRASLLVAIVFSPFARMRALTS